MKSENIQIKMKARDLGEAEVVVVGGGSAGIAASIAAARNGAKTVLLERYGFLGGTATAGLVGPFMTCYSSDGEEQVIAGIMQELIDRMASEGGAVDPSETEAGSAWSSFIELGHAHVTPFDPESLKATALQMIREAGVEIRFHSSFIDVCIEEDNISQLFFHDKLGLGAIKAKIWIDATGDGDLAKRSGVPFLLGRESDGKMMPATLFLRIGNVDDEKVEEWHRKHKKIHPGERLFECIVQEARAEGSWSIPREYINIYREPAPGIWRVNTTRIHDIDGTNPEDLTRAEISARRQVKELMHFFRTKCPGLENVLLLATGSHIGIRETRHICGEYMLTEKDVLEGRRFDDGIARCAYPIDIHDPVGTRGRLEGIGANYYEIPYRCLVPEKIKNLLLSGRNISADHGASASSRVIPPCYATGQAAGTAAALALRDNVEVSRVGVSELQQLLREQGAII